MKSTRRFVQSLSLAWLLFDPGSGWSAIGRLLDATTGKPMSGVWAIGHVESGGGFVIPSGGCRLFITRTDEKGEFSISTGNWFNRLFTGDFLPAMSFYKSGYRQSSSDHEKRLFYMQPEVRGSAARVDDLKNIVVHNDCGIDQTLKHKSLLLPLFKEIEAEARPLAVDYPEKQRLVIIRYAIDRIESGNEIASSKAEAAGQANFNEYLREKK